MALEDDAKRCFDEVVDLPPEARAAWLDAHCRDPAVRQRVERLLAAHAAGAALEALDFVAEAQRAGAAEDLPTRLGPFEIRGVLGRGGMGVVYLAHDPALGRLVALKTLSAEFTGDAVALARFQNEARTLARLHHPGIVPVYSVGEAEGRHYIAMEYVEGETLARRLQRDRARGVRPADPQRVRGVVELVAGVAAGLDHAHQGFVVHRDVKPSNILIDRAGVARLTDFGVARCLDATALTRTGDLAGTCRYMSPEQARASRHPVDGRSDVFSLGVVLYEALSLQPPFDGASAVEILDAVLHREPRRLTLAAPGLPRDLETICHKALEKDPLQRYQSAAHLAADLRSFRAGQPILARPPSPLRRAARLLRRRKAAVLAVACLLLVAAVAWLGRAVAEQRRARRAGLFVSSDAPGVRILGQRADEETLALGPARGLGPAGTALLLEPGLYRLTALGPGGRFAETSVRLQAGAPEQRLHLPTHPPEPAPQDVAGMVLVPAGRHVLGADPASSRWDARREVQLGAFYVDADEVSNAAYREYVAATGAPPPLGWTEPYDPALDPLPVVGVTRAEAEAFARWAGKRLPTLDEWEAAARLGDGRAWPWGDGPPPAPLPSWSGPLPRSESAWRAAYLATAVPVDSRPDLASPAGLRHLQSNVSELVFELAFELQGAVAYKGGHWANAAQAWDASVTALGPDSRSFTLGFRCIRSLSPATPEP